MQVHWLCRDARAVPAADDWLGAHERAVLAGLRVPKRRAEWRLGRWTAKRALLAAGLVPAEIAPVRVEIRAEPAGAPAAFVDGRPLPDVAISLSHRDGVAVCAVARTMVALGCDVERIEPRASAFVREWFTPPEQAYVVAGPPPARAALVTLVWSAKESVAKALGEGWRLDPREVAVAPGPLERAHWTRFEAVVGRRRFAGWGRALGAWIVTAAAPTLPAPPCALGTAAPAGSP